MKTPNTTPEESMEERFDKLFFNPSIPNPSALKKFIRSYGDERERKARDAARRYIEKNIVALDRHSIESPWIQVSVDDFAKLLEDATKLTELS